MLPSSTAPRELTYLALGDSYTIGEAIAVNDCWPMQLVARLREGGRKFSDPRIIATTGWTTDELTAAIDVAALTPPYGLVSLSIGVNNQYRGRSIDNLRIEFSVLLERAIAFAAGDIARVFVVSIPDWGVTRFAREQNRDTVQIASELDACNTAQREISEARGVCWIDITAVSRTSAREMLAADGLHPSAGQYAQWIDCILPAVERLLATD